MSVKISSPEILIACSCPLFISGMTVLGSVFLGLGLLGAISRTSMEIQEKKQKMQMVKEGLSMLEQAAAAVATSISDVSASIDRSSEHIAPDGSIFN